MMRFFGFIVFFTLLSGSMLYAQTTAFKGGEELRYMAEYKIGFFNVEVATVDFTVEDVELKNQDCYKVRAIAQIMPQYKWFFDLRDIYTVWLRKKDMKPIYLESDIHEGSYTLVGNFRYNWDSMIVKTYENRPVWEKPKHNILKLKDETLDAISMFYNMRNLPDSVININHSTTLQLVFANRIRTVQYRFIGRETIRLDGFGKQETLRFRCQLANDSGVSFKDGDEFDLWLSDDKNRIPLFMESPIKVGKVRVRLFEANGIIEPLKKRNRNR